MDLSTLHKQLAKMCALLASLTQHGPELLNLARRKPAIEHVYFGATDTMCAGSQFGVIN